MHAEAANIHRSFDAHYGFLYLVVRCCALPSSKMHSTMLIGELEVGMCYVVRSELTANKMVTTFNSFNYQTCQQFYIHTPSDEQAYTRCFERPSNSET